MKFCPECESTYEAGVEVCPNDGAELLDAALPANPELKEVQPVAAHEATSMIDLEALEHARREQMIARGEDPDAPPYDEASAHDDDSEDPEDERESDPEATGIIDTDMFRRIRRGEDLQLASTMRESNTSAQAVERSQLSAAPETDGEAEVDRAEWSDGARGPVDSHDPEGDEIPPQADDDDDDDDDSDDEEYENGAPRTELSSLAPVTGDDASQLVDYPDEAYDADRYQDERYVDPHEIDERLEQARFGHTEYATEYSASLSEETTIPGDGYAGTTAPANPKKWFVPLLLVIFLIGVTATGWAWLQSEVVTITTLPPGADVWLDNEHLGKSPLQKRMWVGKHKLSIHLSEHVKFEDVVEVPKGGLRFEQRLNKLSDVETAPLPLPGEDAEETMRRSADAFVQTIEELLSGNDLDAAFLTTKRMLKQFPQDRRGDALLDRVIELRVEETANQRNQPAPAPKKNSAPKENGKLICMSGLEFYEIGDLEQAKSKLQRCVQLIPQQAKAHRTLARIFESEKNISKVRYHLHRYLDVGGDDVDGRVRAWLENHPGQ